MRLDLIGETACLNDGTVDQSGRPILAGIAVKHFPTCRDERQHSYGPPFGTDEEQFKRVNNNPTPVARPSRPSRFGLANTPDKMSAKLDKRGATTPTEKAFEQLAAHRAATGMGGDAGLREYAQELVDEINLQTREAAKRRDPSTAETGMPSYVGRSDKRSTSERLVPGRRTTRQALVRLLHHAGTKRHQGCANTHAQRQVCLAKRWVAIKCRRTSWRCQIADRAVNSMAR